MLSGLSFRSAFVSSINSLILSGFPLTSFHLAEANLIPRAILESWSKSRPQSYFRKLKNSFSPSSYSVKIRWGQSWAETSLSTFSWHYILVCAVVQKYHEMFFFKFFLVLILQSTCFIFTTSKRKQTMEHEPYRA